MTLDTVIVVAYGDRGLWRTGEQHGWLEFFLASGVQSGILRSVVMCNAQELSGRLAPFLRSSGDAEHGR
ncbi:hypothetical protein [Nocardia miyunensis]|uniref:hypothetical protein n=1 Tax=Nocardia miyunensis TaxID=282684 RepID=UPI00082BBD75|nr:hypothetical protein [Nocardia miyunensis]